MANRSTNIKGRILRNLKRHGISNGEVLDEEIYDELNQAQNSIISETNPDRNVTITLKEGVEFYPLTTETVTDPALTTYKNNIVSVKVVKQSSGFFYPFTILSNIDFTKLTDGYSTDWFGILSMVPGLGVTSLTDYIKTEIALTGTKNGVNVTFQIPESIVEDSEKIKFNGWEQTRNTDYTISGSTITIISGLIPDVGDYLTANYIEANPYIKGGVSLVGSINGTNTVFTIPDEILISSEEIKLNTVTQVRGVDYTISGSTVTFISGVIPNSGDILKAYYITSGVLNQTANQASIGGAFIGTVVGGKLRVYPIPTSGYVDKEIELYVYMKTSAGVIDKNNEPELDEEWDKSLECFATAQFLSGKDRQQWLNEFEFERKRLKPTVHRKRGTIQRQGAYGESFR